MTFATTLFTWMNGKEVGTDSFGNRYYITKKNADGRRAKRWVMYKGAADPTTVTPEWHGWLHHTTDALPSEHPQPTHRWQQPAQANLSGTTGAYLPKGHLMAGGVRAKNVADYQPWTPE